jgi:hypothetical protein
MICVLSTSDTLTRLSLHPLPNLCRLVRVCKDNDVLVSGLSNLLLNLSALSVLRYMCAGWRGAQINNHSSLMRQRDYGQDS